MKRKIEFVLVFIALLLVVPAFGQKVPKLGHIDSGELLKIMPGRDSAQAILQKSAAELESTLKAMRTELEQRYQDFLNNQNQMSDLIKQTKQKELQDMAMRIEEFQQNAQKSMQDQQDVLLTPIVNKAKETISEVAKENKYTYILDAANLLYHEESDDIMPLVKKKLNLK